jgi:hypothetical protein
MKQPDLLNGNAMGTMEPPQQEVEELDVLIVGAGFGAFTQLNRSVSHIHPLEQKLTPRKGSARWA